MDKNECEDKYSESETEEHLNGKRDLFEWIKKQNGVTNAVLEGWIPETKQRPDIMFEYDGKKYVLEFQCSPIATEYVERHALYEAAGINDIWICGTNKYLKSKMREKYLQNVSYGFYSIEDRNLIPIKYRFLFAKTTLTKKLYKHSSDSFYGLPLDDFIFNQEIFNFHFGKLSEVERKMAYRRIIKQKVTDKIPTRHNKFLYMQNEKINKNINSFLEQLSNNNWKFSYVYFSYGSDLDRNYISAEPTISHRVYEPHLFQRLYINRLNYDFYKKCGRNIEILKKLLFPLMIENKKRLLNYKSDNIRFMEVRDN